MQELKLIPPYAVDELGADGFPESTEMPEGAVSVTWRDRDEAEMVDIKANIVYQALSGEEQRIHLFTPRAGLAANVPSPKGGGPRRLPLVVYVQGSAWHRQNVWMATDKALWFAKRGYAFALVEYRPTDIGCAFPAQRDDAIAAVRFLKERAAEYGVDSDKFAVWGDSSGGHTAVSVGVTAPELVKCVVDWYGPSDIALMNFYPSVQDHVAPESPEGMVIGRKNVLENPELAQAANPINYIAAGKPVPPMLIVHGTKDLLVPFNQSVRLYEKLRACGKDATLYRVEGAGHGYGGFNSDDALELVRSFIDKWLI